MKIITTIDDPIFNKIKLPKIVKGKVIATFKRLQKINKDILSMEIYLKKYYNISIIDVINALDSNFIVSNIGNVYTIEIDPNIKFKGYIYDNIIRLIDFGNLKVKGLHLINTSMEYIQAQIRNIYYIYEKRGLKYVN